MPDPSGDDRSSVSRSIQTVLLLDSGKLNPSGTKFRVDRSNSRNTTASAPPRDKYTMARSWVGGSVSPPRHTQSSPSFAASTSTPMSTSQFGASLQKLSSVVVRHKPLGLAASLHGLNSRPARRVGNGILSGRSKRDLT